MESIAIKLIAFLVAIGVLVAIHEFGHFWVARKLGVKVLKFSIGFGKPLWRKVGKTDNTEYIIAAIPMGGYVKMLDEREGNVSDEERHRAFNRQSLPVRSAIVAAGPLFNFIFAIFALWLVLINGEIGLRPLVGDVAVSSLAQKAGFEVGDEIVQVNANLTPTWSMVVQELAGSSVSGEPTNVAVKAASGQSFVRVFAADAIGDIAQVKDLLAHIGLSPERPIVPPVFGQIVEGEAANQAGILNGDRIISVDGETLATWQDWVRYVQARPEQLINLNIERDGLPMRLQLIPKKLQRGEQIIGRIGASNQPVPSLYERYRVHYQLGVVDALTEATLRTWQYSVLTLKVIGRIIIGEASVHNLSGPITIADAAGKTASLGFVYFAKFLAIVSISLGVLNLLPIPVLDGGHLFYYAIEAVKGSPVSDKFMEHTQKIGMVLLLGIMLTAFYVDLSRYIG